VKLWRGFALPVALVVAACARTVATTRDVARDHRAAVVVAVDPSAGRQASASCPAHAIDAATQHWVPSRDSIASIDARVTSAIDSLFARLRPHARFRHLGSAADYHRQYIGLWFDGRPLVYMHGSARAALVGAGLGLRELDVEHQLIALCDDGTGTIGVLIDPQSGDLGRLEFGRAPSTRFRYDDIVPPSV